MPRIEEIEKRLINTTSGKWRKTNDDEDVCIVNDEDLYICQLSYDGLSRTMEHNIKGDSDFICNAKDDIAYLLKLIKDNI